MPINQLKAGVVLNYVVILLNTLVGLLYTPYMLRVMGQSEYGLYSLVASVISYLTVLDLGFGNAIIRYTAKFRAEKKTQEQYEMFGMFLMLYFVIGIVAFGIGLGLYFNVDTLFGNTMSSVELGRARTMMLLLVFNLAFTFPMSIWGSIIQAYEDFVFQKALNIIRIILNTIVMICLLHFGYKAVAMVVVQTVFNVLTLVINFIYCVKKLKIKVYFRHFQWGFLKEVAIYSFWIFLCVIMDKIYWSTGQFVLGIYEGTVAIAIYAVAIQLQNMYMMFSTAISGVMLPRVTTIITTDNDTRTVSMLFIRVGRLQYIVLAFVLSVFIVFGKKFIQFWAGSNYTDAYYLCLIFFIPFTIDLIQNIGISILQARNQMKFRSILLTIISIFSLFLSFVLVKFYGYFGCAAATGIGLFLGQGIILNLYYYYKQHINIIEFWKEIYKMSRVPIIFIAVGLIFLNSSSKVGNITAIKLFIAMAIFSLTYIAAFWKFGLNNDERSLIRDIIVRVKRK